MILMFTIGIAFGKQIDENTAKAVGQKFLLSKTRSLNFKSSANLVLAYKAISTENKPLSSTPEVYYYIFNSTTPRGFVIVSGDDKVIPVLGYSDQKSFEQGNMMQPLKSLLKSMENTDYNEVKTIEDVKRFADEYERNSDAIIDGFKQGKPMAAPIVALRKGKRPYLISGNTRLMVSKALEIIPELYVINL